MAPDICFLVFTQVHHVCQNFGIHIHDQVWQFHGNCQTLYSLLLLSPLIANLFKNVFFLFLISYLVGKLNFSSIVIKKYTLGHIQQAKDISAERQISNYYLPNFSSATTSFPFENHCKCYKKLASRLWPMLFTLTCFFLYIHISLLLPN